MHQDSSSNIKKKKTRKFMVNYFSIYKKAGDKAIYQRVTGVHETKSKKRKNLKISFQRE